jgi:hypothetical protein
MGEPSGPAMGTETGIAGKIIAGKIKDVLS